MDKKQPTDTRNNALQSILRAVGFGWHAIEDIDPDHFSDHPVAKDIIEKAQRMLEKT